MNITVHYGENFKFFPFRILLKYNRALYLPGVIFGGNLKIAAKIMCMVFGKHTLLKKPVTVRVKRLMFDFQAEEYIN